MKAREPLVGLEVAGGPGVIAKGLVPPAVAVSQVAAPAGFGDVVVEDGHDAGGEELVDERTHDVASRGRHDPRVFGDDLVVHAHHGVEGHGGVGGGFGEGVGDFDRGVEGVVVAVGETYAVEALSLDPTDEVVHGLPVQAFRDVGLHVCCPVHAAELDALAFGVDDPAASGGEGKGLGEYEREEEADESHEMGESSHGGKLLYYTPAI